MNADFAALMKEYTEKFQLPDGLEPIEPIVYECDACQDMGVIRYNVPIHHPLFGKLVPCPDCAKGQLAQMGLWKRRLKEIGLPPSYSTLSFESFDLLPAKLRSGKMQARIAAELFATTEGCWVQESQTYIRANREYPKSEDTVRNWLVFQGPFGCGKTGLAAAAVNALMAYERPVLYMRVLDMIENVQSSYNRDKTHAPGEKHDDLSSDEIIKEFRVAPILVLDDLNVEIESPNRKEILEKIIRHRHDHNLPTLITCNATQKEMETFWGRRIVSVLLGKALWIPVGGIPLRQELPPSTKEAF